MPETLSDEDLVAIEFTPEEIAKVKAAMQVARDDMKQWNLRARVDWQTM